MHALILVDLQIDFAPGGALAVPEGDQVVPVANKLMPAFDLVVATKDWHPLDHGSFANNHPGKNEGEVTELKGLEQVLWPVHCVENTEGAEFIPGLDSEKIDHVIHKGTEPDLDAYSGFYDNAHRQATGLNHYLKEKGANKLYIMGLASDYCLKFTVIDGCKEGYDITVVTDGCRGIDMNEGDVDRAFEDMKKAGAKMMTSDEVLKQRKG